MWGPNPISVRRIHVLITGLPPVSRVGRALGAHQPGEWGFAEELLAIVAEQIDASNRLFVMAHTKRGSRIPDPIRIRRPTSRVGENRPKDQTSPERLKSFFGAKGVRVQYEPAKNETSR